MKTATIIEITTFQLNEGVEEVSFLQSVEKMQSEFLSRQKGFMSRSLTKSQDNIWRDIVLWTDKKSMEETAEKAMKSKAAAPFMGFIDFNSMKMEAVFIKAHYE